MKTKKDILKESKDLTVFGKLFFAGIASYLGNQSDQIPKMPIKIKASKEQIKAISDVVRATKEFQELIQQPDVQIEKIIEKIKEKNLYKDKFKQVTNIDWPL